jgi:pilus assembly protein CpaC
VAEGLQGKTLAQFKRTTNRNRDLRSVLPALLINALLITVMLLAGMPSAMAQQVPQNAPAMTAMTQPVPPTTLPAAATVPQATQPAAVETEGPQTLHLLVGRSLVISSPSKIKRVSLADPTIAEAIVVSPFQVLLNGKAPGGVSLLLWDEADQSQAFEVSVDIDILGLSQKIHEVFPSEPVQVETSRDIVILSGRVSSGAVADKILEVVKAAAPKVTSLMEVPANPTGEILLEVKFADVNRTLETQLGINILSLPGAKNIGTISTQQFSPPQLVSPSTGGSSGTGSDIGLSNLLNLFIFRPDIDFAATIQALEQNNVLQILAEPNLMTESGKEASFLAGGEFPFPILQGTTGGGFAGITIQFKEFGVRLNFTPTLTADGLIHLKVKPEVSSLDFTNALTIQGFLIPALTTTKVESDMQLRDGQSFAIAGLLDNRVTDQFDKIPWIGDVPILGKLFQSRSLTKSKNELLIVVTPRIVHPSDVAPPTPNMPKPFLGPTPTTSSKSPK